MGGCVQLHHRRATSVIRKATFSGFVKGTAPKTHRAPTVSSPSPGNAGAAPCLPASGKLMRQQGLAGFEIEEALTAHSRAPVTWWRVRAPTRRK